MKWLALALVTAGTFGVAYFLSALVRRARLWPPEPRGRVVGGWRPRTPVRPDGTKVEDPWE